MNWLESEAVGKADGVLRRAEGPRGCGICGKEYQATVVSYAPISGMPYLQYLGLDGG